ncbi:hypothetical protein PR048_020234 [Dryococelus australis]|uniref:Uncharacterized protein n=1 Tax=Dryococelus australis TaxID=614101 RepID=A0ABQ9H5R7_9NEOP|nr:hypothetical protein PR048_020234 [Dryococelus australis]
MHATIPSNYFPRPQQTLHGSLLLSYWWDADFSSDETPIIIPYRSFGFWTGTSQLKPQGSLNNYIKIFADYFADSIIIQIHALKFSIHNQATTRQRLLTQGSTSTTTWDFESSQNLFIGKEDRSSIELKILEDNVKPPFKISNSDILANFNKQDALTYEELPVGHTKEFHIPFSNMPHIIPDDQKYIITVIAMLHTDHGVGYLVVVFLTDVVQIWMPKPKHSSTRPTTDTAISTPTKKQKTECDMEASPSDSIGQTNQQGQDGYGYNMHETIPSNYFPRPQQTIHGSLPLSYWWDADFSSHQMPIIIPYRSLGFWTATSQLKPQGKADRSSIELKILEDNVKPPFKRSYIDIMADYNKQDALTYEELGVGHTKEFHITFSNMPHFIPDDQK